MFNIINTIKILFSISAFVSTRISGNEFSTKYLLPTPPKIPPKLRVILVSKSFLSMKKTRSEII